MFFHKNPPEAEVQRPRRGLISCSWKWRHGSFRDLCQKTRGVEWSLGRAMQSPISRLQKAMVTWGWLFLWTFVWLCSIIKGRSESSAHACFQEVATVLEAFWFIIVFCSFSAWLDGAHSQSFLFPHSQPGQQRVAGSAWIEDAGIPKSLNLGICGFSF